MPVCTSYESSGSNLGFYPPIRRLFLKTWKLRLSILLDVLFRRPSWGVGRGEVALVECADLVGLESTNDGVQDATVVEQDKVKLGPIKSSANRPQHIVRVRAGHGSPIMCVDERGCDSWALHLVEQVADLLEVGNRRAIGIQCAFSLCTFRERGDFDSGSARRMDLIMQKPRNWVLPEL